MTTAERLIKHYGDSKKAAAAAMGVHEETVRLWLHNGIPLERALDIEKRSNGVVTAEEILAEHKSA